VSEIKVTAQARGLGERTVEEMSLQALSS